MLCSSCGRENDGDARFCQRCGAPLTQRPGADETRKIVTVVFTDVAGSTALGDRLDPESLRRLLWRWFDVAQETLERHGGTVEKFIGDAVVAMFGVPAAREDDALRAVRAAHELATRLDSLNADVERDHGVRLSTRTGVNTGEVIVGGGAGDQRLATGDAVNVAARLEGHARAGEVVIGETTRAALGSGAQVEDLGELPVKGRTGHVRAFLLRALAPEGRERDQGLKHQ